MLECDTVVLTVPNTRGEDSAIGGRGVRQCYG